MPGSVALPAGNLRSIDCIGKDGLGNCAMTRPPQKKTPRAPGLTGKSGNAGREMAVPASNEAAGLAGAMVAAVACSGNTFNLYYK
jgi:hypothetical protein